MTGGNSPGDTQTLEVGVDPEWYSDPCYNPWDISCADANNEVYCLQGLINILFLRTILSYFSFQFRFYYNSSICRL